VVYRLDMTASIRHSIPTLRGEEAKRFIEFDLLKPTKEDIENQDEAKEKYLQKCKVADKVSS
jgi:hypothetical protein